MKRIKVLLLFLLLFIPFQVFAETCDNSNIEIKSIVQASKSQGTEEKTTPSIENNKINIDVSMSEVNDYIEYNIDVENKSEEELAFNGNKLTSDENHFKYEFTYENDSNIIPANDDKIVSVKITYTREVEESELNNGTYQFNETKKLKLMDPTLVNPKTSNFFYIILFIILSVITVFGLNILKNKYVKALLLLITLIPITVYATCSYEMEINTKIEVSSIPDPVSFATDSWDVIANAVRKNNTSVYNVGDTKTIDMGSFGTHTLRIANKSTPSECNEEGFSQTACGFVLEFIDVITTHVMNDTNTNVGGWPASSMREYVNNDIYNSLPADLKNVIIDTRVVSGYGNTGETNFTSTDRLYLLSTHEVWADADGNSSTGIDYYDTSYNNTRQLDYYEGLSLTTTNPTGDRKQYNGSNVYWWLRSATAYYSGNFMSVYLNGSWYPSAAYNNNGVSPAFRIG